MDKLIITIPDWFIYVIGLWLIIASADSSINLYLRYLERKIKKRELATSSTASYYSIDTLIMAVRTKFPEESRFDTALRYIRQAENKPSGSAKASK